MSAVLRRLYGEPWSPRDWCRATRDDLQCAVGALLLVKMLLLPTLVAEVVPAIRDLACNPESIAWLRGQVDDFDLPELADYYCDDTAVPWEDEAAAAMFASAIRNPEVRPQAEEFLVRWLREGIDSQKMCNMLLYVLRDSGKYLERQFTISNTSFRAFSDELLARRSDFLAPFPDIHNEIQDSYTIKEGGFSWLWKLLEQHIVRAPTIFIVAHEAFANIQGAEYIKADAWGNRKAGVCLEGKAKLEVRSAFGQLLLLGARLLERHEINIENFQVAFRKLAAPHANTGRSGRQLQNLLKVPWWPDDTPQDTAYFADIIAKLFSSASAEVRKELHLLIVSEEMWAVVSAAMLCSLTADQQTTIIEKMPWTKISEVHCTALHGSARRAARTVLAPHLGELSEALRRFVSAD
eukprot:gnl/TRDRNA2_/TRDRNA2_50468_c0_seq1.p1 gnl/TRDRNA2_/TRDRNA2_50468_c0~~gnl/TRDRNA2_/TRDRNA2_50468_c0_seq1.p1  ORF type:complete len:472 (+),score=64.88 gnl/TRDRNA2_/TRDRNA2_50468_c0_seq1:193-1416(+)